jgi:hypothetical protein
LSDLFETEMKTISLVPRDRKRRVEAPGRVYWSAYLPSRLQLDLPRRNGFLKARSVNDAKNTDADQTDFLAVLAPSLPLTLFCFPRPPLPLGPAPALPSVLALPAARALLESEIGLLARGGRSSSEIISSTSMVCALAFFLVKLGWASRGDDPYTD